MALIFKVWAPNPSTVELVLEGHRLPMAKTEDGWWSAEAPGARAGQRYGFILDGAETPLPDPRSRFQPDGVHGLSQVVDLSGFTWTDRGFQARPLASAVIYELHIGAFSPGGTFDSAIPLLDELASLGITHVEVMPVAEFSGSRGWGYDGVDLFAPHHNYGGPEGLMRFINACHARGLAVLLDVVYNHLGPEGSYLNRFGPYFTDHHRTAWGDAANLDGPGSDEVRQFFIDNAVMWLRDYHCDGLRLDAVHALIDTSAVHFLEELGEAVDTLEAGLGRHLVVIAESDLNDPRLVRPVIAGGYGLDATWSDDFHHALHTTLTGEQFQYYVDFGGLEQLAEALERVYVYGGVYSPFRGRRHGRSASGLPGSRFIGYLQNHDQVGNRAAGDRIAHGIRAGLAKIGAALVLTSPFVPMLFMGEEWAASTPFQYFVDHQDAGLVKAVSEGRRREFSGFVGDPGAIPAPESLSTFLKSRLKWEERAIEPHASMLDWHRRLIRLRGETLALADGRMDDVSVEFDAEARWLVLYRGSVAVACNFSGEDRRVPLAGGQSEILLASAEGVERGAGGLRLPPESVAVLR